MGTPIVIIFKHELHQHRIVNPLVDVWANMPSLSIIRLSLSSPDELCAFNLYILMKIQVS